MAIEETQTQDLASMQTPAVFVNRFTVTLTNNGLMRLSYGEALTETMPIQYRGSILTPAADLGDLITVLTKIMELAKSQAAENLAKAMQEQGAAKP